MDEHLVFDLFILVSASLVGVAGARVCGLSAIVGYLVAGLLVGPAGLNLVPSDRAVGTLGELGVAVLMFIVGLELSLSRLIAARRAVFLVGGLQVGLTAAFVAAALVTFGWSWGVSLVLGGAAAMSSTAMVAKHLADQDELNTQFGRLAIGILLFQDLASLPFLILVDALAGRASESAPTAFARVAVATAFFVITALFARKTLARFISWAAGTKSSELLLLSALGLVLAASAAAHAAGLSIPVGAFLVGMVLGESDVRHQIEQELRPFRDAFLGLFFVTVGMSLDPTLVIVQPGTMTALTLALIVGKFAIIVGLTLFLGLAWTVALRAGIILAHAGELSLLLLTQAGSIGVLAADSARLVLTSVGLTMALGSVLVHNNGRIFESANRLLNGRGQRGKQRKVQQP